MRGLRQQCGVANFAVVHQHMRVGRERHVGVGVPRVRGWGGDLGQRGANATNVTVGMPVADA